MGCYDNIPQNKKDALRFQKLASQLPLIRGTVITPEGGRIDLADAIGVEKTPVDPQLAKAQNIFPYIRDTVILDNGQTCSLLDIIQVFLSKFDSVDELAERVDEIEISASEVYTSETRLDTYTLQEGDWTDGN